MSEIAPWSPEHQRPGGRGGSTIAMVLVLLLVGGTTLWLWSARRAARAPAAAACPAPVLQVVAAPEIAPVVQDAARRLSSAGAGCGRVRVAAQEPADTLDATAQPDVWIPSSSAWLRIAAAGGHAYAASGTPLARTPIVLAAPSAVLDTYADGDRTSWARLVAGAADRSIAAVTMPDPRSTVGMLAVYAVHAAMAGTTPDAGIAQLRALSLRSRVAQALSDPATILRRMGEQATGTGASSAVGVFPVTEQQLRVYQRTEHAVTLDGAYPADGLVEVDYPYAVAKNTAEPELAERLRAAIDPAALTRAGFRTASMPGTLGLPKKPEQLLGPAGQWAQYRRLKFQVLLLIDASGSMNDKITDRAGRATTRAGLLRDSGRDAVQLFADDTSIGEWYFAERGPAGPPHTQVVPFGPITESVGGTSRRDLLTRAMATYRAADSAGTPLYRSVLDARAEMQKNVRAGTVTLVVVLTDGRDAGSRYAMSTPAFLGQLADQNDEKRPVPIIAVGYGPDADMTALTAMAKVTGGQAIPAGNPADLPSAMAKAFLAAHLSG